jgi:exonuclease SbcD
MKIGIIGDLHIGSGYSLGKLDPKTQLNSRLIDFSNTFDNIIDEFISRNVELIILTGDIFDTRHPTSAQLNVLSKYLNKITNNNMGVVIVVGNHDQQRTISTTTVDMFESLKIPNVHVYSDFGIYTIDEDKHKTHCILMPYRDRRMIGTKTNSEAIKKIDDNLVKICKNLNNDDNIIVIGHFMIDKAVTGENPDSFSINELILPIKMFKNFDAVIMGHVHGHAILSKNPLIMYSGSMEKISFGEKHHTKVSIIFDTNNIKNPEIIKNKIRNLYEINFDYSNAKRDYKNQITDRIILDINKFDMRRKLKGSIVKLIVKIRRNDHCYVNQDKIKRHIISKKVQHLSTIEILSTNSRQLRNNKITETISGKKAMTSFIRSLIEPEQIKRKLIKFAHNIISEVEGK